MKLPVMFWLLFSVLYGSAPFSLQETSDRALLRKESSSENVHLVMDFIYHLIIRHQYNIVRKKGQIQSIEAYDTEMITIWLQKLS